MIVFDFVTMVNFQHNPAITVFSVFVLTHLPEAWDK